MPTLNTTTKENVRSFLDEPAHDTTIVASFFNTTVFKGFHMLTNSDNSTSSATAVNQKLSTLYRKVRFFIGFKAVSHDGSVANLTAGIGYSELVWNFLDACRNLEAQCRYALPEIMKRHGADFKSITGREMQLSDLRPSFTPADEKLSAVMLDDIDDTCGAHVNIETSPGNFQGHFRLSRPADKEEAMCCIRMLRDWYSSDPGAAKSRQGRRFITPNLSGSIDYWGEEDIDVDYAIMHYTKPETPEISSGVDFNLTADEKTLYREIWERTRINSICAQHPTGDRSTADFRIACYVLEKGGTPDKAKAAVICARLTLYDDKGDHAAGYLQTTINAAVAEDLKKRAAALKKLTI